MHRIRNGYFGFPRNMNRCRKFHVCIHVPLRINRSLCVQFIILFMFCAVEYRPEPCIHLHTVQSECGERERAKKKHVH